MKNAEDGPRNWGWRLVLDVALVTTGVASFVTGIAAICAIWFGVNQQRHSQDQFNFTVQQAKEDRERYEDDRVSRLKPFLAFESSFAHLALENDDRKEYRFDFVRDDEGRVTEFDKFPVIRNYGAGPAFDVTVRVLSNQDPPSRSNERLLAVWPRNIFPHAESRCIGIPPQLNDPSSVAQFVRGRVVITCRDITGKKRESFDTQFDLQSRKGPTASPDYSCKSTRSTCRSILREWVACTTMARCSDRLGGLGPCGASALMTPVFSGRSGIRSGFFFGEE